jgi:hypothetical protein
MRLIIIPSLCLALLALAGCSNNTATPKAEEVRVVPAGEKASVGHLNYTVVDTQIQPQLGEDATPRIPHDRFIVVQIAVTNSSNVDNPIPAVELLSDSGKVYDELTDGTGISDWLGIIRHVGAGQTERGQVIFDAPAAHYRLKFSDESATNDVLADLPLSYSHEKMNDATVPTTDLPDVTGPSGSQSKKK